MRNMLRILVTAGALAVSVSTANAQNVTLLDSIGPGDPFQGSTVEPGVITVGYDPAGQGLSSPPVQGDVPKNGSQAGYAVVPFSLTGSTNYVVSQVSFEGIQWASSNPTLPINNWYGAFIQAPTGNTLSANSGKVIGGFFQLPYAGSANSNNVFVANVPTASQATLTAGQNYWLVIAPKAGFNATNSDALFTYGQVGTYNTSGDPNSGGIPNGTASLNGIATEGGALYDLGGANPGSVLMAASDNNATSTVPSYAAVKLVGHAASGAVPEASTIVTAMLGLAPIGGLLLRRRRAN